MKQNLNTIAVLTGDIVGSTALGAAQLEHALSALEHCANAQADWMGTSLHFTRHRGDGWQVALAKPHYALRSALAFRAALRSHNPDFDSYIAIATGEAPSVLPTDLNRESSEAFIRSGQALDDLKATKHAQRMLHKDQSAIGAATILADHISQGWTQAQAAAILHSITPLEDISYTHIAQTLGKSRQAVTKSLDGAGFGAIELALETLERDFD
ncbi:MarR family transcriptional regulator [Yoonia maritima]|uniref:MarR family transcriptional regulator n=1 Tax=Yoonia maritima TaxID=1435347 RepID=UPI00373606B1